MTGLLPLLIGGYLAVLVFKAAHGTAAAPWRAATLIGYALVGAVLTDLIAGLGIGADSSSHFWPLLPCFWLVTSAVALAAAAIQGLAGKAGTQLVAVLFIVVGEAGADSAGTYLLPVYWRNIGVIFPPQNAVTLIRQVLYFGGNNITTPLVVLFLYAFAGDSRHRVPGPDPPGPQARCRARARPAGQSRRAGQSRHEPSRPQAGHDSDPRGTGRLRRHGVPVRHHLHERGACPQSG